MEARGHIQASPELSFHGKVAEIVSKIPRGRVMTYGQVAAAIGHPRAARQVGGAAHFGDSDLPWHRVVNAKGGLASGYPGGRLAHRLHLESESIVFSGSEDSGCYLNLKEYRYEPNA